MPVGCDKQLWRFGLFKDYLVSLQAMLTARNKMAMMIPRAANVPTINRASVVTKSLSRTTVVESLGGFPPTNRTNVSITSNNRSFGCAIIYADINLQCYFTSTMLGTAKMTLYLAIIASNAADVKSYERITTSTLIHNLIYNQKFACIAKKANTHPEAGVKAFFTLCT